MRIFSSYLVPADPLTYSDELKDMFDRWPKAARHTIAFSESNIVNIVVFVSIHPTADNPVEAYKFEDDEFSSATTKLLSLMTTYADQRAVLISQEQTSTIYAMLDTSKEKDIDP